LLKARDQELKSQDIAIKMRRLELLEKNASSAKEVLSNTKLSSEEQAARVREIFKK
jgi:hypothetical protein